VSEIKKKINFTAAFQNALATLNPKQLEAVNAIEGPVMVIAGPGTGKTQLLAARIGSILDQVEVNFKNILCLTYTDAGSVAMRQRLLKFIGPEAYNINIYTFHAFCNSIIQENIQYFGGYRDLQRLSDLEAVDVYEQIIDEFSDDHPLKRFKGNVYFDRGRLKNLFSTMKQENWTPEILEKAFEKVSQEILEDEAFQYKRKGTTKEGVAYAKGDPNPRLVDKELKRYAQGAAAAQEFNKYNSLLAEKERLDYNDMILWVIQAFKENPDLLASYQERYQYILVDEYQDSNGAQNDIIDLLASFWGAEANLFVVGDDDQSIFRFQGANMQNIVLFEQKYNPKVIVLENNYRSSQEILDRATALIDNNVERLVATNPELTKKLIESKNEGLVKQVPQYLQYHNEKHEEKAVINKIIALREQGVNLSEIAIIYRKHRNIDDIVKYLEYKGVPINLKKRINVLNDPEIKRLLNILRYLGSEYDRMHRGDHLLFEILHYKYFGLTPRDVGKLSIYCSQRTDETEDDIRWRDVLSSEEHLKKAKVDEPNKILVIGELFESWIGDIANVTIQTLFEKILTQGKVIDQIMIDPKDKTWRLQVVNTFFDFIKDETSKNPSLELTTTLMMVEKMIDADIALPLEKIFFAKEGVNLMTAHGAKGLEFEYVFMIKCFEKNWVESNNGSRSFKLPKSLVPASDLSDIEDDRRLFYVAMTRAKSYLYISWPKHNNDDKDLSPCRFISESMANGTAEVQEIHLEDKDIEDYSTVLMKYQEGEASLIDHDLIDRVLQDYKVSVTSLNKYLKCPLAFYFENILRVPLARSAYMGFGSAVHDALEKFFGDIEKSAERKIGPVADLISYFEKSMKKYASHFTRKESGLMTTYGTQILNGYYDTYSPSWSLPREYKVEHKITLAEYKGVPITGKLDKIAVYDDHVVVIDYKTGKPSNGSPKVKPPKEGKALEKIKEGDKNLGGDYWRQIVFYKMLLDGDPTISKKMKSGIMDFIEPEDNGKNKNYVIEVKDEHLQIVEEQLVDTYAKISAHKFEEGCGKEDCKWCDFVNSNFSLNGELIAYQEDEENN